MRLIRRRIWARTGLVAVLLGAAAIAISAQATASPPLVTTASGAFTITGSLGGMSPGLSTTLHLTVNNPQTTSLYLQSVSASVVSAVYAGTTTPAPAACAGYLSPALPHTWTAWTGVTTIPAASGPSTPGTGAISVPLSFTDSATNQNACENVTFSLAYAASAYYSDPTTTALVAAPNPANIGAPVTLTATVSRRTAARRPPAR